MGRLVDRREGGARFSERPRPHGRVGVTARPAFSSNRCRWRGSADQSQSVSFDGKTVTGIGRTFVLGENTLFLDYGLERAQLAAHPYAFNNLKDAKGALRNGTADKPMMLLTAPGGVVGR